MTLSNRFNIPPEIILYGGTGQAKVVRPIIEFYGSKVVAVFDDTDGLLPPFDDIALYRGFHSLLEWIKGKKLNKTGFCITIGNPHGKARMKLHNDLVKLGLTPATVVHHTAFLADNCSIGDGSQIMAGVIIMPEVKIGKQCIINTKSSIDHECVLEDACEVAPGATLCGCVHMKFNSWVCAGATVLPRITLGENSIVGAGSLVREDVPDNTTIVGVPANRFLKRKSND